MILIQTLVKQQQLSSQQAPTIAVAGALFSSNSIIDDTSTNYYVKQTPANIMLNPGVIKSIQATTGNSNNSKVSTLHQQIIPKIKPELTYMVKYVYIWRANEVILYVVYYYLLFTTNIFLLIIKIIIDCS